MTAPVDTAASDSELLTRKAQVSTAAVTPLRVIVTLAKVSRHFKFSLVSTRRHCLCIIPITTTLASAAVRMA